MLFDYVDRIVIEQLSENSRSTLKDIAEKANCSLQTVRNRINNLEQNIGLRHTIEPDFSKMGYSTEFFVRVKFKEGTIANTERLMNVLGSCPYIQFAALTKGDFDLFLWSIAPSKEEYEAEMEAKVRVALDEYIRDWTAHSLLVKRTGFLPVGNEIIDHLPIKESKRSLLRLINENSRISLMDIARNLNVSKPTALYHLKKMSDSYLKRFTSFFDSPSDFTYVVRFFQVCGSEETFKLHAPAIYNLYVGEPQKFFNKVIYSVVPDGGMDNFFLEAFSSIEEYNKHNEVLARYSELIIRKQIHAIITKVLKGKLAVRKIELAKEVPFLLSPLEG